MPFPRTACFLDHPALPSIPSGQANRKRSLLSSMMLNCYSSVTVRQMLLQHSQHALVPSAIAPSCPRRCSFHTNTLPTPRLIPTLDRVLKVIKKKYPTDGSEIVLLTDGEDSTISTCFDMVKKSGAIIHTVALGPAAAKELEQLSKMTGEGRSAETHHCFYQWSPNSSDLRSQEK